MNPGVENPSIIDYISEDPRTGAFVLVIVENREWNGSAERIAELQCKLNAYLSFALDGELAKRFPDSIGKPVRVELFCVSHPDPETSKFLEFARSQLRKEGVQFEVVSMR